MNNRIRRNVRAQESVVSALWEFAADIQKRPVEERICRNTDLAISLALDDIGKALGKIMHAFGYTVTPIE